ncbi:pilus assembly protein [Colwellia hornerae]|uniref:rRNA (Guanine-N1)-methyltransferase n=1 Tax=Colwellia hornerae TaxID=89402 RepID=A0A5C6Q9G9_9GAMM|nr:PilC/PilY family type IV pilus protein [Colwellia hornerae]TWX50667.1 rRNA (guanine-N1)-methyltransferase [Colwellia hornerae]TWX56409.1 rRNA (guanine-N1)-methyltransferase [Colwellia hornerae]TWX65383.1 rRNA (guanine-N1)-methyltransferase [Colwellia hornerae]
MKKLLLFGALIFTSLTSYSEDIELYIGDAAQRSGNKPQVLIIFDNSGSMNSLESVDEPYNPATVYPAVGSDNSLSDKFIYFTRGGIDGAASLVPDSPSERRRFLDDINSCATARERLASVGFYTGHIREYAFQGNSGSWQEIPDNNGANIEIIDCEDDVNLIPANPEVNAGIKKNGGTIESLPDGFPIDGEGSKQSPVYYTANAANSNVIWSGEVVTLYTDNYLRWANSDSLEQVNRTRLEIAQDTVTDLIESAPSVDFGLQVFNYNHSGEFVRDGGRIVFGIQEMTAAARADLVNIIDLEIDGETNTPLCESLYEASRYFSGQSVDFGDNDSNSGSRYRGNTPPRDTSIEDSGVYKSPFSSCTNEVYVIMITDGEPTRDLAANTYIQSLPDIGLPFDVNGTNNYLAALAGWMHTHDLHSTLPDVQSATLFTIGFGQDAIDDAGALLREAANLGGGQYYPAKDPSALLSSLQSALTNILEVNTSFTAPSVASNNFDRTETLDSVYYAMFVPDHGARWQGNLKKLKVTDGQQVDRTGAAAIDNNGNISKDAKTFWSTDTNPDGNDVKKGGVAEMLRTKSTRVIISDLGLNNALAPLNRTNAETSYGDAATLALELDVTVDEIDNMLNWAKGIDVDDADNDGSTTDIRRDVFGDPLHSKPLVVNYGGSSNNQDIRIIVGTNAGVLHMFDDNGATVDENWAFLPKEFFSKIKVLRENFTSSGKSYGIDSPAVSYLLDVNGDGSIDSASGDKAWIFFGLRRGGSSYYAMDISDPDLPKLLWHIDADSPGFSHLGQSWSQPKIGFSALNLDANGALKPVLFFAGGYDTTKDNLSVGADDELGRAVYMVDAATGTLKWSLSPEVTTEINTQFTDFTDSIPSSLATLDSDSDGLTDRLYFGDTGGNVWRIDMPGNNPFSGITPWTAFKLGEFGGTTHATDRRFFSEPSIARTFISDTIETTSTDVNGVSTTVITKQERPYEAVLIGSGDRSTPAASDTDDKFFMIKDANIITTSFVASATHPQRLIPAAILATDLYDYTNNPFGQTLTVANRQTLEINVGNKKGWFIDFLGDGEKNTASAIVINGVAYFTSFTPAAVSADANSCELSDGSGILYAVDLAFGTTVYDWRTWEIAAGIPDTPSIIITKDPQEPVDPCSENCPPEDEEGEVIATIKLLAGKIIPLGISLETSRIYLYVTESN